MCPWYFMTSVITFICCNNVQFNTIFVYFLQHFRSLWLGLTSLYGTLVIFTHHLRPLYWRTKFRGDWLILRMASFRLKSCSCSCCDWLLTQEVEGKIISQTIKMATMHSLDKLTEFGHVLQGYMQCSYDTIKKCYKNHAINQNIYRDQPINSFWYNVTQASCALESSNQIMLMLIVHTIKHFGTVTKDEPGLFAKIHIRNIALVNYSI